MLAGAFAVAAIVWQFGNVIGSRTASREHPANAPAAVERWGNGIDDAGGTLAPGVVDGGGSTTAATSGTVAVEGGAAAPASPVLTAPAGEPLAERDLLVPVEGVEPGDLVRSFSDSRGGRTHEAIDILAPRNTPVRAIDSGKIARL